MKRCSTRTLLRVKLTYSRSTVKVKNRLHDSRRRRYPKFSDEVYTINHRDHREACNTWCIMPINVQIHRRDERRRENLYNFQTAFLRASASRRWIMTFYKCVIIGRLERSHTAVIARSGATRQSRFIRPIRTARLLRFARKDGFRIFYEIIILSVIFRGFFRGK